MEVSRSGLHPAVDVNWLMITTMTIRVKIIILVSLPPADRRGPARRYHCSPLSHPAIDCVPVCPNCALRGAGSTQHAECSWFRPRFLLSPLVPYGGTAPVLTFRACVLLQLRQ